MNFCGDRGMAIYLSRIRTHGTERKEKKTIKQKKQVAQLSQRDRAAGWVSNGQKWKTGTERQYLRTM